MTRVFRFSEPHLQTHLQTNEAPFDPLSSALGDGGISAPVDERLTNKSDQLRRGQVWMAARHGGTFALSSTSVDVDGRRSHIETAFEYRTSRSSLIVNTRARKEEQLLLLERSNGDGAATRRPPRPRGSCRERPIPTSLSFISSYRRAIGTCLSLGPPPPRSSSPRSPSPTRAAPRPSCSRRSRTARRRWRPRPPEAQSIETRAGVGVM
jgi:hypothetical protein